MNLSIYKMCVCLRVSVVELRIDAHTFELPWKPIRERERVVRMQAAVTLLLLG